MRSYSSRGSIISSNGGNAQDLGRLESLAVASPSGAVTELCRSVGAVVLFGLLFSPIVTLTFLPSLTSLVLDLVTRSKKQAANP
mgnify:CR=1 FL=1